MPEWKKLTLSEVTINHDSRRVPVKGSERKPGPYPYYGASGVVDHVDGYIFDGPYLLIAEDGENLRTRNTPIAFMASGKFWVNNHAHVVQGNELANSHFLSYLLARTDISGYLSGSTQPKLTQAAMNQIEITLPSRQYQEAIVRVLGALDDKIAVNDRINSVVQELGDAYFVAHSSATQRSTLAELVTQKSLTFGDGYRTKRSEHGQPGLPILRVAEVMHGRIEPDFVDFVADSYRLAMGGKVSQTGDVILTTKGTVGRVAVITAKDPSFVYSPQLCYFRVAPGSPISNSYIYFWLRSKDFWQQAETLKSQTDMADYLSLTDIRNLTIPMPPATGSNEQQSPTMSGLLAQISARHEENRALAELRDALLPKLMSGEIRVRDAEKVVEKVT